MAIFGISLQRLPTPSAAAAIPILVLLVLVMMLVPLPPILLDILFTFNIAVSIMVLILAINIKTFKDFVAFPTVLLLTTLLRLSLNVASTRVVLIEGHTGPAAAGKVIEAFGQFLVAGNFAVGIVIFIVITIINFMVITKGSGRVAEVSARFALDSMPGKQMAIDADLSAGIIDQETAKKRREELSQESDFFGSMDGASKFVSGDALAGLLILLINLIGGLVIGMGQHGLPLAEVSRIYLLLTIGDGLVAQIPALFLSLATAIIVTRVTTAESMTEQAKSQLSNPSALFIAAGILGMLGIVPGMPHLVFLTLAAATAGLGLMVLKGQMTGETAQQTAAAPTTDAPKELDWDDVESVDLIGLEIGYGLIPLVNTDTGGQLMTRVKGVRKKLSAELGFLVQPVRIRDVLSLPPDSYNIVLNGVVRARGEAKAGRELAINPGKVYGSLEGTKTREPAFGLEAVWIEASQRDLARSLGYTVVDAATAVATHLNKVLRDSAAELLSHDETQKLLDKLSAKSPKLVEELVPAKISVGNMTRVLQNLLAESVPIRDMRTVAEALTEAAARTQDVEQLTAMVRPKLGRMMIQNLLENRDTLSVMTLSPNLEQLLHSVYMQGNGSIAPVIEPQLAESLFTAMRRTSRQMEESGLPAVLVVSPNIRSWLSRMIRPRIPDITTLSYSEIPDDQAVKVVFTVEADANNRNN